MIGGAALVDDSTVKAAFSRLSNIEAKRFFLDEFKPMADKLIVAMRNQAPVSETGSKNKRYPHPAGNLRTSIGRRMGGREIPTVWIGSNRRKGTDAYYDMWVIGGHNIGKQSRSRIAKTVEKEYGTSKTKPNPFIRRAWDSAAEMIKTGLKSRFENKLGALVKK